jgi:hypothetical protein
VIFIVIRRTSYSHVPSISAVVEVLIFSNRNSPVILRRIAFGTFRALSLDPLTGVGGVVEVLAASSRQASLIAVINRVSASTESLVLSKASLFS